MSRTTTAWVGVALILISCTFDMLSDVFIRGRSTPAILKVTGANPGSWDVLTAILAVIGLFLVVAAFFDWRP